MSLLADIPENGALAAETSYSSDLALAGRYAFAGNDDGSTCRRPQAGRGSPSRSSRSSARAPRTTSASTRTCSSSRSTSADPAPACPSCGSLDVAVDGGDEVVLEWLQYAAPAPCGPAMDGPHERVPAHVHDAPAGV